MDEHAYWTAIHQIAALDLRDKVNKGVGWIYAFTNNHYSPQMYKVGKTARPPHLRLKELSSQTGVPCPFEVVYFVHVLDRKQAEHQVHQALFDFRVSESNEFFTAPLSHVKRLFDQAAEAYPTCFSSRGKRRAAIPQPYAPSPTDPQMTSTIECISCLTENRIPDPQTLKSATCGKCGLVLPTHI